MNATLEVTKVFSSHPLVGTGRVSRKGFDFQDAHPIVFISAGKHHPFTDTGWDGQDSPYSCWWCDDHIDGKGSRGLALPLHYENGRYVFHNVGNKFHPFLTSPNQVDNRFYDYNLWTTLGPFCGAKFPSGSNCTSTVLRDKFRFGW